MSILWKIDFMNMALRLSLKNYGIYYIKLILGYIKLLYECSYYANRPKHQCM